MNYYHESFQDSTLSGVSTVLTSQIRELANGVTTDHRKPQRTYEILVSSNGLTFESFSFSVV
jgi:hypothetical protein